MTKPKTPSLHELRTIATEAGQRYGNLDEGLTALWLAGWNARDREATDERLAGWNEALTAAQNEVGRVAELQDGTNVHALIEELRLAPPPPAEETEMCPICRGDHRVLECDRCDSTGRVPLKTTPAGSAGSVDAATREDVVSVAPADAGRPGSNSTQPSESGGRPIPSVKPLPDAPGWWVRTRFDGRSPDLFEVSACEFDDEDGVNDAGEPVAELAIFNRDTNQMLRAANFTTPLTRWYGPLPLEKP